MPALRIAVLPDPPIPHTPSSRPSSRKRERIRGKPSAMTRIATSFVLGLTQSGEIHSARARDLRITHIRKEVRIAHHAEIDGQGIDAVRPKPVYEKFVIRTFRIEGARHNHGLHRVPPSWHCTGP